MNRILSQIHSELLKNADEKVVQSTQRFFLSEIKSIGVKAKIVKTIARTAYKEHLNNADKSIVYAVAEELMKSSFIEEIGIGIQFVVFSEKLYEKDDIMTFDHWIDTYVTNWATCDSFCNHAVGMIVEHFPENIKVLKHWSKSKNLWLRRASAVSLIIPARKGLFFEDILEIAETLLLDKEDMVQKGYGWMLKAASMTESFVKGSDTIKQKHFKGVFDFVMKHKVVMPRTSLRYAIEKFSDKERKLCMER